MATSLQLDEHITCPICQDIFNLPKMLPCQHTYCFKCLEDLLLDKTIFTCPECRVQYPVSKSKADGFPTNRFVVQLIEQVRKLKRRCSICVREGKVIRCDHCSHEFCQECEAKHISIIQNEIYFTAFNLKKLLEKVQQCSLDLEKSYQETTNKINAIYGKRISDLEQQIAALNAKLSNSKDSQNTLLFEASKLFFREQEETKQLLQNGESMNRLADDISSGQSSQESQMSMHSDINQKLSELQEKAQKFKSKQLIFIEDTSEVLICDDRLQRRGEFCASFSKTSNNNLKSQTAKDCETDAKGNQIENIHVEAYRKKKTVKYYLSNQGLGIREFKCPQSVISDNINNEIVILDNLKKNVLFYDENGSFLRAFHCEEIHQALNITVSHSTEQVMITDSGKKGVHVYSRDGRFIRTIGSAFSSGSIHLKNPFDLATDRGGQIFVSDSESDQIHVFSSHGWYITSFGETGRGNGEFRQPLGITVSHENKIFICDSENHRLQIFSDIGRHLFTFGVKGTNNGEFISPASVAVDLKGFICVNDRYNYRIQVFSPEGNFITFFGSHGFGDGQFLWPCKITITSNFDVVINDTDRKCIQLF